VFTHQRLEFIQRDVDDRFGECLFGRFRQESDGAFTAHFLKKDYEAAYRFGKRGTRACPNFSNGYKPLIAALGHLGQRDEAAPYVQKLLQLEPHFTIARFIGSYPLARQEDRENYARGLELAGVPKG
jgi:hypothetical protein